MENTDERTEPEGVDVAGGPASAESRAEPEDQGQEQELSVEEQLARAQAEIAELKEAWARERADFSNFRKRTMTEKSRARTDGALAIAHDFLAVFDDLERVLAVETEDPAVKGFVDGVRMIQQSFLQALERHKIKSIIPVNEPFNPSTMEAIAMENRSDLTQETVLQVFQAGFVQETETGEKHWLRPARVKVGKPEKAEASVEESSNDNEETEETSRADA